jgi:hypothetical protein
MTYWILSLALVSFGVIAALSIGRPFMLIGLTMLLLGRWRHRPAIFWPPLLAMIAYAGLAFLAALVAARVVHAKLQRGGA